MENIQKFLVFIGVFLFLSFGAYYFETINAQEEDVFENLFIQLHFSPSVVSPGNAQHMAGYLNIVDEDGLPVLSPDNLTIDLISGDPSIASVPEQVVFPVNSDYVQFPVTVTELEGESEISAKFQGRSFSESFRVGGISVDVPINVELVIALPTNNMHVESEMPFSVYLDNDGTVLQAPKDIEVFFEYEKELIELEQNQVTIKKGDYYATNKINSRFDTGTGFVRAITNEPPLDSFKDLSISSSLPTKLQIYVYPSDIIAGVDREIDIFVGLFDEFDNPVTAQKDIEFELLSNIVDLNDELNEDFQFVKPRIREGEWGFYHKQDGLLFNNEEPRNFINAFSDEFGFAESQFRVLAELDEDSVIAENKTLIIYSPPIMPPDSTGILVYQVGAIKGDDDDEEAIQELIDAGIIDEHPFTDEDFYEEGDTYPVKTDFDDFDNNELQGRVVSSNTKYLKVLKTGEVNPERSYGTAFLKSSKLPTDSVKITAAIKGVASSTTEIAIANPLSPDSSVIFSPTGNQIVFNDEGKSEIFIVNLDEQLRPASNIGKLSYLLTPANKLIDFDLEQSYARIPIDSSSMVKELETGFANVTAYPIGTDANTNLFDTFIFPIAPASSTVDIELPINRIVGYDSKEHVFGMVQLTDFFGNPVTVSSALKVEITANNTEIADHPKSVIIPEGRSYVQFHFSTFGERGAVTLSANARGFVGSDVELEYFPFVKELILFPVAPSEPVKPGESVEVQVFVDDENAVSVNNALIEFYPQENSTMFPTTVRTDENGLATALFTNLDVGISTSAVDVFASKSGFIEDRTTLSIPLYQEAEVVEQTLFGVDPLILYGAIGGGVAAMAGIAVKLLRKPKVMTEEEAEEEEI